MKHSILRYLTSSLIAVCLTSCEALSQTTNAHNQVFNKQLETLLNQKEYFLLESQMKLLYDSMDEKQRLYYECFVDYAFNRNEKTITGVNTFLTKYTNELVDSINARLLLLKADSYYKQFEYAKAAMADSLALSLYSHSLSIPTLHEIRNDLLARNALKSIPPQELIIKNNAAIQWKKDRMNLIEIPVKINAENLYAVFDTKANYSCVTQSYAKKLGLKMLDVSIEEGSGLTGVKFKNSLAIADSVTIGTILIKNAVFLVMPDDKLDFGPFSIHLIIGYPIIEQLKEIQFHKDGRLVIPLVPTQSDLHNLALDGLNPVLSVKTGNDTLCFHLDLGAVNTYLYSTYFERYKEIILRDGKSKTLHMGGAGGSKKRSAYIVPKIEFTIGNKSISLNKVYIITEQINSTEGFYGNLGKDFMDKFEVFTLNFNSMYFKVQ